MGKETARRAFGETRVLRKSGAVDYRLYLTQASIELHVNGEPEVRAHFTEYRPCSSRRASADSSERRVAYCFSFFLWRACYFFCHSTLFFSISILVRCRFSFPSPIC